MLIKSCGILMYRVNSNNETEVFLIKTNTKYSNNLWGVPKGRSEKGEKALQTAKREFYEETGTLAPEQLEYLPIKPFKTRFGKTIIVFTANAKNNPIKWVKENIKTTPVIRDGKTYNMKETRDGKWFTLDEAYKIIGNGQKGILDNFLEHLTNQKAKKDTLTK